MISNLEKYLELFGGGTLYDFQKTYLKQLLAGVTLKPEELRQHLPPDHGRRWIAFDWSNKPESTTVHRIETIAQHSWSQFERTLEMDRLSYQDFRENNRRFYIIDEESWVKSDPVKPGYAPGDEIVCWYSKDLDSGMRHQYAREVLSFARTGVRKTWSMPPPEIMVAWTGKARAQLNRRIATVGQYPPPPLGRAGLGGTASSLPLTAPGGPFARLWPGQAVRPRWVLKDLSEVAEKQREAYLKACNPTAKVHDAVPPEQRLRVSEVRSSARNELRPGVGKPGR